MEILEPSLVLIIWLIETFEAWWCLFGGTKVVVFKTFGFKNYFGEGEAQKRTHFHLS